MVVMFLSTKQHLYWNIISILFWCVKLIVNITIMNNKVHIMLQSIFCKTKYYNSNYKW
jgi:maltodextrin utilization protein YvdJ